MLTKLKGQELFTILCNGIEGKKQDIYVQDGKIVAKPAAGVAIDKTYDLTDKIVMAGAIDILTHIGGGKVNIARMMLPEDHEEDLEKKTEITRAGVVMLRHLL